MNHPQIVGAVLGIVIVIIVTITIEVVDWLRNRRHAS